MMVGGAGSALRYYLINKTCALDFRSVQDKTNIQIRTIGHKLSNV